MTKIIETTHYRGRREGEIVSLPEALTRLGFGDLASALSDWKQDQQVAWFGAQEARSGYGLPLTTEGFGPQGEDGRRLYQEPCVDTRSYCGGQCLFGLTYWKNWGTEQTPNWGPMAAGVYVVADCPPDRPGTIVFRLAFTA
jgi:hypothetical protein